MTITGSITEYSTNFSLSDIFRGGKDMFNRAVRFALVSSLFICFFAITASAQDEIKPEKRALIKELYALSQADRMADSMLTVVFAQLEKNVEALRSQVLEGLKGQELENAQKAFDENSSLISKRVTDKFR